MKHVLFTVHELYGMELGWEIIKGVKRIKEKMGTHEVCDLLIVCEFRIRFSDSKASL